MNPDLTGLTLSIEQAGMDVETIDTVDTIDLPRARQVNNNNIGLDVAEAESPGAFLARASRTIGRE